MGQLLFKKCFWNAIRDGSKRTTIRRWPAPRIRAGSIAYTPGVGWLTVESVEPIRFSKLTAADAIADGFETLAAMKRVLREIYPSVRGDGCRWFRVAFRFLRGRGASPRDHRK